MRQKHGLVKGSEDSLQNILCFAEGGPLQKWSSGQKVHGFRHEAMVFEGSLHLSCSNRKEAGSSLTTTAFFFCLAFLMTSMAFDHRIWQGMKRGVILRDEYFGKGWELHDDHGEGKHVCEMYK